MNKEIFFAHSGGPQGKPGRGSYDFVQWLRENLGEEFQIHDPVIEEPDAPTYDMWAELFDRKLTALTGLVFLVGHSLGGSTLLKYLSETTCNIKIAGLFLAAPPFWGKGGWEAEEFALRNNPLLYLPVIPAIHLYHCLNDAVVPIEHAAFYRHLLPGVHIHKLEGDAHAFSDGLPILMEHIISLNS